MRLLAWLAADGADPGASLMRGTGARIGWGVVIFVCLAVWRWDVLSRPPDHAAVRRHWLEGDFLAQTGFDFHRLTRVEQTHSLGGALVYGFNGVTWIIAALIRWSPTREASFIAFRLFNWACAAWIVVELAAWLRVYLGRVATVCLCVYFVTMPSVWAQIDLLNMELAMAAPGMAALRHAVLAQPWRAAALGFISQWMKASGALVVASMALFVVLAMVFDGLGNLSEARQAQAQRAVFTIAVALALCALRFQLGTVEVLTCATLYLLTWLGLGWAERKRGGVARRWHAALYLLVIFAELMFLSSTNSDHSVIRPVSW